MENAVELNQVTKTFGSHTAVNELSLNVPSGSVYGFIGPNGSGKTTTLRMIMNIYYPDSGGIRVFGESLHGSWTDRIGYLPEERGLYKKMSVRDILKFYGQLKNGTDLNEKIADWLERFELTPWAGKKVETLSKGMSQKVQFIATVITKPEMVILDEPFSGLDPVNAEVLKDAVLQLQKDGTTVIFSTHDMAVAEKMCNFIFMIFKGNKVLDGSLSEIQDKYGADTIRVRIDGDSDVLSSIDGVDKVNDYGQVQELRMQNGTDSQSLLTAIMSKARVRHFEISRPSLHDIFVRIAGPEAEEASHA
ncbi:MAG: putative ABC transporter ATP-binding protein YhaQ [Phycisphaerae bacterium]|nr:MAG: putative ABC transporter ATP-binding protein YhaQ [Phycisphaerae bacterium]